MFQTCTGILFRTRKKNESLINEAEAVSFFVNPGARRMIWKKAILLVKVKQELSWKFRRNMNLFLRLNGIKIISVGMVAEKKKQLY